jgi:hypothetical protein
MPKRSYVTGVASSRQLPHSVIPCRNRAARKAAATDAKHDSVGAAKGDIAMQDDDVPRSSYLARLKLAGTQKNAKLEGTSQKQLRTAPC